MLLCIPLNTGIDGIVFSSLLVSITLDRGVLHAPLTLLIVPISVIQGLVLNVFFLRKFVIHKHTLIVAFDRQSIC